MSRSSTPPVFLRRFRVPRVTLAPHPAIQRNTDLLCRLFELDIIVYWGRGLRVTADSIPVALYNQIRRVIREDTGINGLDLQFGDNQSVTAMLIYNSETDVDINPLTFIWHRTSCDTERGCECMPRRRDREMDGRWMIRAPTAADDMVGSQGEVDFVTLYLRGGLA